MKHSIQLEAAKKLTSQQWPQYLAVISACLISFANGLQYAWPSPSLPILQSKNLSYNITSDEASYIVSISPLGSIVGSVLAACIVDIIGRKNGILITSIPLFTGWMIIAFAESSLMFYIGRFITGISDGIMFIVCPMYIGEVAEPKNRGVLGCCMSVMNILGALTINAYGSFLSIRNAALLSSIFPILSIGIFVWMPESPVFYIMKNKIEKAKESLMFLQRCDISKKIQVLQQDVERQMSEKGGYKDLITIKSNRKAMWIIMGIRTIQQMSGVTALSFFTQTIFRQVGGNIPPVLSTIVYLLTQLIMTTFGSILADKYGRKPLLICSSIGTGILLNIVGVYFFLKEATSYDTSVISWLPICVMICYVIIYSIGLGTVPSLVLVEMFSASVKGKALCIMGIYYNIVISCVSKLFSFMSETYGMYTCFFLFGTSSIMSIIFSYYFVLETKGKSLEEIQQHLKGNYASNKNTNNNTPA